MQKLFQPAIVRKELNDEHYYYVDGKFFPSVTKILHETLPTPIALKKWLGDLGNEKAEEKMERAGTRGTLIHQACEKLIKGETINLDQDFPKREDKKSLVGFVNWFADFQPQPIPNTTPEMTVASQSGYAGTIDYPCQINTQAQLLNQKIVRGIINILVQSGVT